MNEATSPVDPTQIDEFRRLCSVAYPATTEDRGSNAGGEARLERMARFYALVCAENAVQNLTRLVTPEDFVRGHVRDVDFLEGLSGFLGADDSRVLDWGSGVGVPGLLCAAWEGPEHPRRWWLCESEGRKAQFLESAVQALGLAHRVRVSSARAETVLKRAPESGWRIVARAVGPVDKFWGWAGACFTWNMLVLLKGPQWQTEWPEFVRAIEQRTRRKCPLRIVREESYGPEGRLRAIELARTT